MDIEQILKDLGNHHQFAQFLQMIYNLREETIAELHEADRDKIQQLSGRILSYDQILVMCEYESLKKRHSNYTD